ncbi:MAG: hypothetical protein ACREQJ_16465 [Candidatus Binatia bacterium]
MTTMRSLAEQLPDRDELLRTIGLQMRRDDSSILSSIAIFAAGLAIGAGVAYFLTEEMRGNGAAADDDHAPAVAP